MDGLGRISLVLGGALTLVGAAWALLRPSTASAATAPTQPPKTPAPKPNPPPMPQSPSSVYATLPADAVLHSSGWVPFRGVMITALPLIDSKTGQFARLRYKDALQVANEFGAMLLTTQLIDAVNDEGLLLDAEPCELVQTAYDASHMATIEYAQKEDRCIRDQLAARNWDGKTPVGNGWKDWIRGAAKGMALNYGWRKKGSKVYVQTLGTKHNDQHTDYSQLTRLVKGA